MAVYQLRIPLADGTLGGIPFHVNHSSFPTKPPIARVASVHRFSASAILAELCGCPREISGSVKNFHSLRERLATKSWRRGASASGNNASIRAADSREQLHDEFLSFAHVLRWLDRCTRLEGTGCSAITQKQCDSAIFGFASSHDFTVGTFPSVRTCATVRSQSLYPRLGTGSTTGDTTIVPELRWEARWLRSLDALRSSAFSLRVTKAHILDTLELSARVAYPDLLSEGMRIVDVGAGGGLIDEYLERKYGIRTQALEATTLELLTPVP